MDLLLHELAVRPRQHSPRERCLAAPRLHRHHDAAMEGQVRRRTAGPLDERRPSGVPARLLPWQGHRDPETHDAAPECAKAFLAFMQGVAVSPASRSRFSSRHSTCFPTSQDARAGQLALGTGQVDLHADGARWFEPSQRTRSTPGWTTSTRAPARNATPSSPPRRPHRQAAGIRLPTSNRAPRPQRRKAQKAARKRNRRD